VSGLAEIKVALADALRETYEGLANADGEVAIQIEPRYVIDPSPPTIDVYPGRSPSRDLEVAGMSDGTDFGAYMLTVRARVLTADQDAGQDLLDEFADDASELSLPVAIEGSYPLDDRIASIDVVDFSGLQVYQENGIDKWLGMEYIVRIIPALS